MKKFGENLAMNQAQEDGRSLDEARVAVAGRVL